MIFHFYEKISALYQFDLNLFVDFARVEYE